MQWWFRIRVDALVSLVVNVFQIDILKAETQSVQSVCTGCWTGYKSTVMGALFRIIIYYIPCELFQFGTVVAELYQSSERMNW